MRVNFVFKGYTRKKSCGNMEAKCSNLQAPPRLQDVLGFLGVRRRPERRRSQILASDWLLRNTCKVTFVSCFFGPVYLQPGNADRSSVSSGSDALARHSAALPLRDVVLHSKVPFIHPSRLEEAKRLRQRHGEAPADHLSWLIEPSPWLPLNRKDLMVFGTH